MSFANPRADYLNVSFPDGGSMRTGLYRESGCRTVGVYAELFEKSGRVDGTWWVESDSEARVAA